MEIRQVEIAKNISDLSNFSRSDEYDDEKEMNTKGRLGTILFAFSSRPRIRVLLELKNNSMDSVWFYTAKTLDKFNVTYEYKDKQYSQEMSIPSFNRKSIVYKIPPGETEEVSVRFMPELLEDDEHPLNASGYAQMLWEILPSIKVTYTRCERARGYTQSDPITASWGDQEDISIAKAQKEMK